MAKLLKNMYNHESLNKLAIDIKPVYSTFPADEFLKSTMDKTWDELEFIDVIQYLVTKGVSGAGASYDS